MAITLAALGYGLGSCWLGALNRDRLAELFQLPDTLVVLDMIALGYPAQKARLFLWNRETFVIIWTKTMT